MNRMRSLLLVLFLLVAPMSGCISEVDEAPLEPSPEPLPCPGDAERDAQGVCPDTLPSSDIDHSTHPHDPPRIVHAEVEVLEDEVQLMLIVLHAHVEEVTVEAHLNGTDGSPIAERTLQLDENGTARWSILNVSDGDHRFEMSAHHAREGTSSDVRVLTVTVNRTASSVVESDPLLTECLADHSGLAAHYHPLLTITVNGDQMRIDPNTGIGTSHCPGGNMHIIHVHDAVEGEPTKLHIEHDSSITDPITLGLFFEIWGVEFSSERIGTFTVDAHHELIVRVDGVEVDTYEDTPLEDLGPDENGQEINQRVEIIYRLRDGVSDLGAFWSRVFMCQQGAPPVDDLNTTEVEALACNTNVTVDGDNITIVTNGLPNHDFHSGPGCCASSQTYTWTIPRYPVNDTAGEFESAPARGPVAVAINGVPFYGPEDGPGGDAVASHHGMYEEDRQEIWLGLCHGHSGPGGTYHYHADANCLHHHPDDNESWTSYDLNSTLDGIHDPVIGVGFDGYPIYGIEGYDSNGTVVPMTSSYQLLPGATGYGGISDYAYVGGSGHLDACNGHWGPTPDFPDGIYHYHSTITSGDGGMGFPYFLNCYRGVAIMSNSDGGAPPGQDQGGDCEGHGVTWGPGIGPPPDGCEAGPPPGAQSASTSPILMSNGSTPLSLLAAVIVLLAFAHRKR